MIEPMSTLEGYSMSKVCMYVNRLGVHWSIDPSMYISIYSPDDHLYMRVCMHNRRSGGSSCVLYEGPGGQSGQCHCQTWSRSTTGKSLYIYSYLCRHYHLYDSLYRHHHTHPVLLNSHTVCIDVYHIRQGEKLEGASLSYLSELFDSYSATFDASLAALEYKSPQNLRRYVCMYVYTMTRSG